MRAEPCRNVVDVLLKSPSTYPEHESPRQIASVSFCSISEYLCHRGSIERNLLEEGLSQDVEALEWIRVMCIEIQEVQVLLGFLV